MANNTRMDKKSKVLFVGVGGCGNNYVNIMEKRYSYDSVMVDSDLEALNALKPWNRYHLEGSSGFTKDPYKLKEVMELNNNAIKLQNCLIRRSNDKSIVFVAFASGGGTGSSLGIEICKYYLGQNKIVCPIIIIPNEEKETVLEAENTLLCIKKLHNIESLGATFYIDNKKTENIYELNDVFTDALNEFLSHEHSSMKGNIALADYEYLLSKNGAAIVTKLAKKETDAYNLRETLYNNIYAPYHLKVDHSWAVRFCDELREEEEREIKKRISDQMYVTRWNVYGYGGNSTVFITSGLQVEVERFNLYVDKCNRFYSRRIVE